MKIYISGKITGLPIEETKQKFDSMQDLLEELNFEVFNPLSNPSTVERSWNEHMLVDIEKLFQCDCILLLKDWMLSTGALIEHDIAFRMNKFIFLESEIKETIPKIQLVKDAIYEVTGISLKEYTTDKKDVKSCYCRMLFSYYCEKLGVDRKLIAKIIKRDRSTMFHILKKYDDDSQFDKKFRKLSEDVRDIIEMKMKAEFGESDEKTYQESDKLKEENVIYGKEFKISKENNECRYCVFYQLPIDFCLQPQVKCEAKENGRKCNLLK